MTAKSQSYEKMDQRLSEVLADLQKPDISVDKAMELHEEGTELVGEMQKYLKKAENQIHKITESIEN